jgi:hypothetical protein
MPVPGVIAFLLLYTLLGLFATAPPTVNCRGLRAPRGGEEAWNWEVDLASGSIGGTMTDEEEDEFDESVCEEEVMFEDLSCERSM